MRVAKRSAASARKRSSSAPRQNCEHSSSGRASPSRRKRADEASCVAGDRFTSPESKAVGLSVNIEEARALLDEAVDWASSERRVPSEWIDWTHRVDASPSKTFTVALGTALLAKAANPSIDALALKATSGPSAYSARTVAHKVLVPGAVQHGYDLRATGREPLNNQPFFRYDRIDEIDRIHSNAKPFLPDLIAACTAVNQLDASEAQAGLAAFLRIRIEAARERQSIDLPDSEESMGRLLESTETFVISKPEGGRRGQAFVAAAFDLVFSSVRNARVNDPSRRFPGDVQVLEGAVAVLAAEVRQKPVSYFEALQFAESLQKASVATGLLVMLNPEQDKLDDYDLLADAENLHGVALSTSYRVQDLLMSAVIWCGKPHSAVLTGFPQQMLARLEEIDASRAGIKEWLKLFD
jgi:SacI restriction endonuclease